MNREDMKSAIVAFFEQLRQIFWPQPEQALKPIPIEQQTPRHPRQR